MIKKHWLLIFSLVISLLAHSVGMFRFPYIENDEGVYVSQAWSWASKGELSPYTYWYDHAPGGWIQIGMWQKLTGGPFTFGASTDSGRVLMLLVHLGSTALVYFIARRLCGSSAAGFFATLVFSLSPLAIYFQRRVLLDNITTFWILVSFAILLKKRLTLFAVMVSGLAFAVAVLSKEVAVFLIPAYIFALGTQLPRHRVWGIFLWLTAAGVLIAAYPLFALLKSELFPAIGRVSLLGTLIEQLSRGIKLPFWNSQSLFYDNFWRWSARDPVFVWGAILTFAIAIPFAIWQKYLRMPLVFFGSFAVFLLRSSLIIDFYFLPLVPFASIIFGMLVFGVYKFLRHSPEVFVGILILVAGVFLLQPRGLYNRNETAAQRNAVEYLKANAKSDSKIVADSSIFLDLRMKRNKNDIALPYTHWAWKFEKDPTVYKAEFGGDFRNVDYVVVSHEIMKQIHDFGAVPLKNAVDASERLKLWNDGSTAYIDLDKYISTNGDWMSVYKTKSPEKIVMDRSWDFYKKNFIFEYGRVHDPQTESTTSEGQSYALLRAVWQNDPKTFDDLWQWTKNNMQFRREDKLLSWKWRGGKVADSNNATDADIDIAMALLFASKAWNNSSYLIDAKTIIADIWRQDTLKISGRYFLLASEKTTAKKSSGYLVNPSYFSPAAFKMFATVDASHPWTILVDDGYRFLESIVDKKTGLVPNWVWIDELKGKPFSAAAFVPGSTDEYGFDGFRTFFRLGLDFEWYKDVRAKTFLDVAANGFFAPEWERSKNYAAIYSLQGKKMVTYSSFSTTVGALVSLNSSNSLYAGQLYRQIFDGTIKPSFPGYWGEQTNYYNQNWMWFGNAYYNHYLPNLWEK